MNMMGMMSMLGNSLGIQGYQRYGDHRYERRGRPTHQLSSLVFRSRFRLRKQWPPRRGQWQRIPGSIEFLGDETKNFCKELTLNILDIVVGWYVSTKKTNCWLCLIKGCHSYLYGPSEFRNLCLKEYQKHVFCRHQYFRLAFKLTYRISSILY